MSVSAQLNHISHADLDRTVFGELLDRHGYVYMDGIPDGFDHVAFCRQFGDLMPQYDGELIWSIKAHERFDDLYHSLNTKPLMPHTECYEYTGVPPQYLALWCLVRASDGGGQTTLADAKGFIAELSEKEREMLAERQYKFVSSAGVQDMELGRTAEHPVYERREQRQPIFRFSYNCVVHDDDPFLLDIRERFLKYFDQHHVVVDFEPNALLIWNNHRVVHSRTGYTDRKRHLRRIWLAES